MRRIVTMIIAVLACTAAALPAGASEVRDVSVEEQLRARLAADHEGAGQSAPTRRAASNDGTASLAATGDRCFDRMASDPANDTDYIDAVTYGAAFYCDTSTWGFALTTDDTWVRDELDYLFFFVNTDGNATNGCLEGDYVVSTLYDYTYGFMAGVHRTPSCDSATWTYQGDAYAERADSIDFIGVLFDHSQIGSPSRYTYYGAIASIYSESVDRIPDVGHHTLEGFGGSTNPDPPPAESTRVAINTSVSAKRAAAREPVAVDGYLAPGYSGAIVTLQRYSGARWVDLATREVSQSTFSFTVREPNSGVFRYRVVSPGDDAHTSATGPSHTLTVYEAKIVRVVADAPGNDNDNLNGEYVIVKNTGTTVVRLGGWDIASGRKSSALPAGRIQPGARVKIHSGKGDNTARHRYLGRRSQLLRNAGGTVRLYNANDVLVSRLAY